MTDSASRESEDSNSREPSVDDAPAPSWSSILQPPDEPLRRPRAVGEGMRFPLLAAIRLYQLVLRPVVPAHCRHVPSCSRYAVEAIRVHGIIRGCGLATLRILRCQPWGTSGFDPVPERRDAPPSTDDEPRA